jgi:hypothetical protein
MTNVNVRECDSLKKRLKVYRDTDGLTWTEIALKAEFLPIPAGTLCSIYHGCPIPKKWFSHFGLPRPRPPRIAIRLDNPESAARSIRTHMDPEVMDELIALLKEG